MSYSQLITARETLDEPVSSSRPKKQCQGSPFPRAFVITRSVQSHSHEALSLLRVSECSRTVLNPNSACRDFLYSAKKITNIRRRQIDASPQS
jgi:hypothetical protein